MRPSLEDDQSSLEALASSLFAPLTEAERRLLQAVPRGEFAHCGLEDPHAPENNPRYAEQWGPERAIRAALVRWLCLDPAARAHVAPEGIRLFAAHLDAQLNLSFMTVPFPLGLFDCWIPDGIRMDRAQLPELLLTRSRIGSDLSAIGSQAPSIAILADGVRIGGLLKLAGTDIAGEVRLFGASVGSTIECDGARFRNAGGVALNCELATTGSVHLRGGLAADGQMAPFAADGQVLLRRAKIHGNLECQAAHFRDSGRTNAPVLSAEDAKIDGSVFLRAGFVAEGGVRLVGAEIANDLDVADATFPQGAEGGLTVSRAKIKGSFHLERVKSGADTWFVFEGTTCEILDDAPSGWPQSGHVLLDGLTYKRLERPADAKTRLAWLRSQLPRKKQDRHGQFRPQPYRQLAQVLRAQGHEAEALDVLVGMAHDRLKYARLGRWSRFWTWVLWHVIRNGYRPLRATAWLVALWLTSACIFNAGYDAGLIGPTDQKAFEAFAASHGSVPDWYPPFRPAVFAIDISLPIISLGERDKWRPLVRSVAVNASVPTWAPGALSVWRWVAIALGWFLASMLVAGVTGLVARQ